MVDITSLYPVVHDLTEAEYSSSDGCCVDLSSLLASINELIIPSDAGLTSDSTSSVTQPQLHARSASFKAQRCRSAPDNSNKNNIVQKDDCDESMIPVATAQSEAIRSHPESFVPRSEKFASVYVLTRQINRGSCSTVWECIHRITGMRYEVKIIDRRGLCPAQEEDVHTEVGILDSLGRGNCNTLTLEDFFDEPTHFYIVTSYAQGRSLKICIKEKQCFNEEEAKDLARSLLEGVECLHGLNICHRVLTPENILVSSSPDNTNVVIADFGLAAHVGPDGLMDKCGTASYVAPEVLNGRPYDTQADLWSVGVVMYFVLGGHRPFVEKSKRELCRKICKGEYAFHPQDWDGISTTAKHFVSRLLQVDPRVRMTATEALQHPWLAIQVPLPPPTQEHQPPEAVHDPEIGSVKSSRSSKRGSATKRIRRVWRALGRVGDRKENKKGINADDDQELSSCSDTVSVGYAHCGERRIGQLPSHSWEL